MLSSAARCWVLAALTSFCTMPVTASLAAETLIYAIPANDGEGYGIADCMQAGGECGRVMADALCAAHGHVKAMAYGAAADVTGSVTLRDTVLRVSPDDIIVRCTD